MLCQRFESQVIYQLCQSMPGTGQGQSGTSSNKQGQSRDKQGQGQTGKFSFCLFLSLFVPACLCLSLLVPVCPCLSMLVHASPCLSLSVPVCLYILYTCLPLQMNITVFISMNIVTLTFLAKATVPMHAQLFLTSSLLFILLPQ